MKWATGDIALAVLFVGLTLTGLVLAALGPDVIR